MSNTRKIVAAAALIIVVGVCAAIYFCFDPAKGDIFFPKCPFLMLTGHRCPGCGSQRAIHSLLHGNVIHALRQNALAVIAIPVIALSIATQFFPHRLRTLNRVLSSSRFAIATLVVILAWWALRF